MGAPTNLPGNVTVNGDAIIKGDTYVLGDIVLPNGFTVKDLIEKLNDRVRELESRQGIAGQAQE